MTVRAGHQETTATDDSGVPDRTGGSDQVPTSGGFQMIVTSGSRSRRTIRPLRRGRFRASGKSAVYLAGIALLAVAIGTGALWLNELGGTGVAAASAHDEVEASGDDSEGHADDQHDPDPGAAVAPDAAGLRVEWSSDTAQPQPGQQVVVSYQVIDEASGETITDLPVAHERPMHLIVTSRDLVHFQHVHPELETDGVFQVELTLPAAGTYLLFNEFVVNDVTILDRRELTVGDAPGTPASLQRDLAAKTIEGVTVALAEPEPVQAGALNQFTFTVSQDGQPVTDLSPYLGAAAHVAIVSEDSESFAHTHGEAITESAGTAHDTETGTDHNSDAEHGSDADRGTSDQHASDGEHASGEGHAVPAAFGPEVVVEHTFPAPGFYRLWIEVSLDGGVIAAPFTIEVE